MTYCRSNHKNMHVRGYKEEGTTTTPFDRLPHLGGRAAYLKQALHEKLVEHKQYVREHGDDMPEIAGWCWGEGQRGGARATSTEGDNV